MYVRIGRKEETKEKFALLSSRLKATQEKLETAQRSGINAERLLLQVMM